MYVGYTTGFEPFNSSTAVLPPFLFNPAECQGGLYSMSITSYCIGLLMMTLTVVASDQFKDFTAIKS